MADLSIEELTGLVREKLAAGNGLNGTVKVAFDEGGQLLIAGRPAPGVVTNEDGPADLVLRLSLATLNKLHRRELSATSAVMAGKIKIEGNLMLAMQLDKILS